MIDKKICLATDERFKHHRTVLGPSMTPTFLSRNVERIVDCVDQLLELWETRMAVAQSLGEEATDVKGDISLATFVS